MSQQIHDPRRDTSDDALGELGDRITSMNRRGLLGASALAAVGALVGGAAATLPPAALAQAGCSRATHSTWAVIGNRSKARMLVAR